MGRLIEMMERSVSPQGARVSAKISCDGEVILQTEAGNDVEI